MPDSCSPFCAHCTTSQRSMRAMKRPGITMSPSPEILKSQCLVHLLCTVTRQSIFFLRNSCFFLGNNCLAPASRTASPLALWQKGGGGWGFSKVSVLVCLLHKATIQSPFENVCTRTHTYTHTQTHRSSRGGTQV